MSVCLLQCVYGYSLWLIAVICTNGYRKENLVVPLQHHLLSTLNTNVNVKWHILPYTTGSHCRQVDISPEKGRFGNMMIITSISIVSWLSMASLSSPFIYEAAKVIFGSIYLHLHLQTVLNLQDLFDLKKVDISTDTTLYLCFQTNLLCN